MKEHITEIKIGNTLFIVTAECSPTATETIEKKFERLITRGLTNNKISKSNRNIQLAICSN